jgi:multiple antibiotic resistance protein
MTPTEYGVLAFSSLFVIVDPLATVPAFLAMTARYTLSQRLRMARMACCVAFLILSGFALAGQWLFSVLGITLAAVQVAGALVLLLVALDMLRAQRSAVLETAAETAEGAAKDDIAITPLAVPMLAGPAAISTIILLDAQAASWLYRGILLACVALVGLASHPGSRRIRSQVDEPTGRKDHHAFDGLAARRLGRSVPVQRAEGRRRFVYAIMS